LSMVSAAALRFKQEILKERIKNRIRICFFARFIIPPSGIVA